MKIEHSIDLLKQSEKLANMYDPENGFYLAFSAGKDSQALYHLAQLAGVKFKAHMNLTSVDPPEVIRFAKRSYPEVELIKPKDSIFNIAVQKGILPSMKIRWCCAEFKESAGAGKVTLIGIRHAESSRRAKRKEVEVSSRAFSGNLEQFEEFRQARMKNNRVKKLTLPPSVANPDGVQSESVVGCITGKESILISPIIDWTEKDVWFFLNEVVKVPHCSLYDEGWTRLGCIGCPMSSKKQKIRENKRWPHVKRNWIKAIKAIRLGGGCAKPQSSVLQQGLGVPQKKGGRWICSPELKQWEAAIQRLRITPPPIGEHPRTAPTRANYGVWGMDQAPKSQILGFLTAPRLTA